MAHDDETWDVFLAHAGPDAALAANLFELLAPTLRVFLDARSIQLGDDWDTELARAQRRALVTVVLVSANTERAYYEREEIAAAIALARQDGQAHRVVPVYVSAAALENVPYGLRLKHGLTLSETLTLHDAAERLRELLNELRAAARPALDGARAAPRARRGLLHEPAPDWVSPAARNRWRYKVVALDLDGTLLRGGDFAFSWERVWRELNVSKAIQNELRRAYRLAADAAPTPEARIGAYRKWCEAAVEHFRQRGLTRAKLREVAARLQLTLRCREALVQLRDAGVVTAIISGGIDTFLEDLFPEFRAHVDFVFVNQLLFDEQGGLTGVEASAYDFEGKAEALSYVCKRAHCSAAETVFVGDRFNDEQVMLHAALAIAYPPQDLATEGVAAVSIREDDLTRILPHVFVE